MVIPMFSTQNSPLQKLYAQQAAQQSSTQPTTQPTTQTQSQANAGKGAFSLVIDPNLLQARYERMMSSTPEQKVAGGYLTREQGLGMARGNESARREQAGLATYDIKKVMDDSGFNAAPHTTIAYDPEKAAQQAEREQWALGTPGTERYKYLKGELDSGVDIDTALNNYMSDNKTRPTGISTDKAGNVNTIDITSAVNDLMKAGYSSRDARQLAGTISVDKPTPEQQKEFLAVRQNLRDQAEGKGDYAGNKFVAGTIGQAGGNQKEMADALAQKQKFDKNKEEGKNSRGITADRTQAAWETRFGSTGWGQSEGSGKTTTSSASNQGISGNSAQDIVKVLGTSANADVLKKAQAQGLAMLQQEYATGFSNIKGGITLQEGEPIPQNAFPEKLPSGTTLSQVTTAMRNGQIRDSKGTVDYNLFKNYLYQIPKSQGGFGKEVGESTESYQYWKKPFVSANIGSFGSKYGTHKPQKKQSPQKTTYGSGFIGMISELNKSVKPKKTTFVKKIKEIKAEATKQGKQPDTWADIFLTPKKVSNTKQPAIKLPSAKNTAKKEDKYVSAWEQILFNKPKQKTNSSKKGKA